MLKYLKSFGKIVGGSVTYVVGIIGLNVCTNMIGVVGCFALTMGGLMLSAAGWVDFICEYTNTLEFSSKLAAGAMI